MNIKYILFDCMETIIDLKELPIPYASWSLKGSGCEHYWGDKAEFYNDYDYASRTIASKLREYEEYNSLDRYKFMAERKLGNSNKQEAEAISLKLLENHWSTYKKQSYVKADVLRALQYLKGRYKLGIVSNFMILDGIEELLTHNGIYEYFDIVVTSVREGWRKPHPNIYKTALDMFNCHAEDVLFVGDDYTCDYIGPGKLGIKAVLLDRENRLPDVPDRILNFDELIKLL